MEAHQRRGHVASQGSDEVFELAPAVTEGSAASHVLQDCDFHVRSKKGQEARDAYRSSGYGSGSGESVRDLADSNTSGTGLGKIVRDLTDSNTLGEGLGESARDLTDSNTLGAGLRENARDLTESNTLGTGSGLSVRELTDSQTTESGEKVNDVSDTKNFHTSSAHSHHSIPNEVWAALPAENPIPNYSTKLQNCVENDFTPKSTVPHAYTKNINTSLAIYNPTKQDSQKLSSKKNSCINEVADGVQPVKMIEQPSVCTYKISMPSTSVIKGSTPSVRANCQIILPENRSHLPEMSEVIHDSFCLHERNNIARKVVKNNERNEDDNISYTIEQHQQQQQQKQQKQQKQQESHQQQQPQEFQQQKQRQQEQQQQKQQQQEQQQQKQEQEEQQQQEQQQQKQEQEEQQQQKQEQEEPQQQKQQQQEQQQQKQQQQEQQQQKQEQEEQQQQKQQQQEQQQQKQQQQEQQQQKQEQQEQQQQKQQQQEQQQQKQQQQEWQQQKQQQQEQKQQKQQQHEQQQQQNQLQWQQQKQQQQLQCQVVSSSLMKETNARSQEASLYKYSRSPSELVASQPGTDAASVESQERGKLDVRRKAQFRRQEELPETWNIAEAALEHPVEEDLHGSRSLNEISSNVPAGTQPSRQMQCLDIHSMKMEQDTSSFYLSEPTSSLGCQMDEHIMKVLEKCAKCREERCQEADCVEMRKQLTILMDVRIEELSELQVKLLQTMVYHSFLVCSHPKCSFSWCWDTADKYQSMEEAMMAMKKRIENYAEYCSLLNSPVKEFMKLNTKFPLDSIPIEGQDWERRCMLKNSRMTMLASPLKSASTSEYKYWVIKKIMTPDVTHHWDVYRHLQDISHQSVAMMLWAVRCDRHLIVCHVFENLSLSDCLNESSTQKLGLSTILSIMRQLTSATSHLHSIGIAYLYWISKNILVAYPDAERFIVKLSNFSCSVLLENYDGDRLYMTLPASTMAPELRNDYEIVPVSDVWGIGCLLYEVVTGKQLWNQLRHLQDEDIHIQLEKNPIPELPTTYPQLMPLFHTCWEIDWRKRKTLRDLEIFLANNNF